jgi:hypothetical protein
MVHHPQNAPVVRLIFELFVAHKVKLKVAELLNGMGHSTANGSAWTEVQVDRVLKHTSARGIYAINTTRIGESGKREPRPESEWIRISANPIVSDELFEEAAGILSKKPGTPAGTVQRRTEHTFTDLAFCSCGGKMRVPTSNPRYVCPNCNSKMPIVDLENLFACHLKTFLLEDEDLPTDQYSDISDRWLDLPPDVRRDLALSFLDSLTVDKQEIHFTYRIPSSLKDATSIPHTVDPTDIDSTDSQGRPIYVRLPKAGTSCPHSAFSRAKLNQLILPTKDNDYDPPVTSKVVTQPGKKRGVRLIVLSSLLKFLEQC